MNTKYTLIGLPLAQAIALFSFLTPIISIRNHQEISLAALNVELSTSNRT